MEQNKYQILYKIYENVRYIGFSNFNAINKVTYCLALLDKVAFPQVRLGIMFIPILFIIKLPSD